jgi:hypothetical protein
MSWVTYILVQSKHFRVKKGCVYYSIW